MQKDIKTKLNPITILGVWVVSMLILTLILMFVTNTSRSGGEQKPFTMFTRMIVITIYGAAAISILTPILLRQWFKKNVWFTLIILAMLIPIFRLIKTDITESPYSFSESFREINGDTIVTKTEFYAGSDFKKIRSIRFLKNSKRDSVWLTYSENGTIIKKEVYRNDTLITR